MPANRVDRINSLLEQEVGKIIRREVFFPEGTMVTVTRAQTSGNIIECKIYISVFPEAKAPQAMETLKKAVAYIQQILNKKLNMRPVPKIIFVTDDVSQQADRVEELLHKLKKEEN